MEHFLVIGSIEKECTNLTALLGALYPGCKIDLASSITDINTVDLSTAFLFILFEDAAPLNEFTTDISLLSKKVSLLFIADNDTSGLEAITAGANDYILTAEIHNRFADVVRKALARKNFAAAQTVSYQTNNTKDAYELMLISLNEVIWAKNPGDLQLEFINNACESLFGYSREELMADHDLFIDRVHPDDRERYSAAFRRMQEFGNLEEYEFRFQTKDGTWKHLKGKGTLVKGSNGKNLLTGITVDITRLVTSENIVKEKTREVEGILESISECFYSVDKDWKFTYINRALEDLFQVKREDLLGKCLWELFPLGKETEMYTNYHLAVEKNRGISFEAYSPNIKKWIFISAYPNPNGLTIFLRDISARKELEEKIFTDQQNLLTIINATSDVIWSVDNELNILVANQAFWDTVTRTHGKTREEMGTKITEDVYGKEIVQHWKGIYDLVREGHATKIVETNNSILGVTYSEISINPIRSLENNIIGMSCFSRDITKTREHLLKIEEQNQKMREIAWIQSHKVRGPVSTILGLAALFNMTDLDSNINQKVLEGIKETSQYLDEVIREIVDKAKAIE